MTHQDQWTELEGLAEAATPGPWVWEDRDLLNPDIRESHKRVVGNEPYEGQWLDPEGADAAFIAAANPSTVLALIAENRVLRDKVEGLDADLRSAVQVAWKRGAREWARLNYRSMVEWLEASDAADRQAALADREQPGTDYGEAGGSGQKSLSGEAVAWRVHADGVERGLYYHEDVARGFAAPGDTVTPLYAAPSSQGREGGDA